MPKILACIAFLSPLAAMTGCATSPLTAEEIAAESKAPKEYVTGSILPQRNAAKKVAMTDTEREELRNKIQSPPPVTGYGK